MKGFTKIIVDIGPLAIFFIFYTRGDLQSAILPFMIATVIAVLFSYVMEKKIPIMPTVGAAIILIFGGLTIYFDNPVFLYMKPTVINVLFGFALLFGKIILKEPLLKKFLQNSIKLDDMGWSQLNTRWMYFFFFLAILNEIVWRTQSEEFWVNFKVWGLLPITFIFTAMQVPLLNKYKID